MDVPRRLFRRQPSGSRLRELAYNVIIARPAKPAGL